MPIFKYAKALLLTPAIGSFLICSLGLLAGVVFLSERGKSGHGAPIHAGQPVAQAGLIPRDFNGANERGSLQVPHPAILLAASHGASVRGTYPTYAPGKRSEAHLHEVVFQETIASDQLEFLKDYAERTANDVDGKKKVRTLVDMVAPYTPYHFGADFPLPQVLNTLLLNEPQPIEIRDGRYAMMSGIRNAIHRRAGFLWIDMREGFALGAIYFDPSNGEPSPTLTIFSRQLDRKSVSMNLLPRAFVEDLSRWAAREGVPSITTRYFIGAFGDKYVLAHDENYCAGAEGMPAVSPKSVCEEMNAQAALIDMNASRFMEQTHNASNATMRMTFETGQTE